MPKKTTEQQLARRLAIIEVLPRHSDRHGGLGMTVSEIATLLKGRYPVTTRTYERDLIDLSDPNGDWRGFGLEVTYRPREGDERIKEWYTTESSKIPLFKSATPADALVASLARQELGPFLPSAVSESLDEQVKLIEERTRHLQMTGAHREIATYKDKIRRVPDGAPMAPSKVHPQHLQTVNDALMNNLMLQLTYRAAKDGVPKAHTLYPVGLVIHDRSLRLLAVEAADLAPTAPRVRVKSFHLHRIQRVDAAVPNLRNARVPTLDQAIADGVLDPWSKGSIALHLRFAENTEASVFARTLEEMPLAKNQKIYQNVDGQTELTATVIDTSRLRRLLQSMAREVKVLAPESLRNDLRQFLADGLAFQQSI